jgi:hypothetical protein
VLICFTFQLIANEKARPDREKLCVLRLASEEITTCSKKGCNRHADAVGHEMLGGTLSEANGFVKSFALIAPKRAGCGRCNFGFGSRARRKVMARGLQFRPRITRRMPVPHSITAEIFET